MGKSDLVLHKLLGEHNYGWAEYAVNGNRYKRCKVCGFKKESPPTTDELAHSITYGPAVTAGGAPDYLKIQDIIDAVDKLMVVPQDYLVVPPKLVKQINKGLVRVK